LQAGEENFRDVIFESSCINTFVFFIAGPILLPISHFIDKHAVPRRFLGICRPSQMLNLAANPPSTQIGWIEIGQRRGKLVNF